MIYYIVIGMALLIFLALVVQFRAQILAGFRKLQLGRKFKSASTASGRLVGDLKRTATKIEIEFLREASAPRVERQRLPYSRKLHLLSRGERAFYHTLDQAIGDRFRIAVKVRVSDLLSCSAEAKKEGYFNKINQKHIDFVLFDADTTAITCAIELDDRSHQRPRRVKRDEFINQAFEDAGLPLLRYPAAWEYDTVALLTAVNSVLQSDTAHGQPPLARKISS